MTTVEQTDIAKRVGQYIALRDKINALKDEFKERMKPFEETLDELNALLLKHLEDVNADSAATANGTVYRTMQYSASVTDKDSFWAFVVATGNWDLVDNKANKTAVKEFAEQHGSMPPGVNMTTRHVVGVRRPR